MRWLDTAVCLFLVFYLLRRLLRMTLSTEASWLRNKVRWAQRPPPEMFRDGLRASLWSSGFLSYAALRAQLPWWWASLAAVSTTYVLFFSIMLIFSSTKTWKQRQLERAARGDGPVEGPRPEAARRMRRVSAAVTIILLACWTYSWSHLAVGGGESHLIPASAGVLVAVLLAVLLAVLFVAALFWPFRTPNYPRTLDSIELDIRCLLDLYLVGSVLLIKVDETRFLRLTRRWLGTHAGVTLGLPYTAWVEQHSSELTALCDEHAWTVDRRAQSDEHPHDLLHIRFGADATSAADCVRAILTRVLGLPLTATVHVHGPMPGEQQT